VAAFVGELKQHMGIHVAVRSGIDDFPGYSRISLDLTRICATWLAIN
jgi:hypothetical protein